MVKEWSCSYSRGQNILPLQSCTCLGLKMPKRGLFVNQNSQQSQGLSDLPSLYTRILNLQKTNSAWLFLEHSLSSDCEAGKVQRGMNSITCHVACSAGLWSASSLPPQLACLLHASSMRQLWATPATFTREPAGGRWGQALEKGGCAWQRVVPVCMWVIVMRVEAIFAFLCVVAPSYGKPVLHICFHFSDSCDCKLEIKPSLWLSAIPIKACFRDSDIMHVNVHFFTKFKRDLWTNHFFGRYKSMKSIYGQSQWKVLCSYMVVNLHFANRSVF